MSRHRMRSRRLRAARRVVCGFSARVVDRVLIVTRPDGIELVEDLREHRAFDHTDEATLQRWYWMGPAVGVWWIDPDDGIAVRHMRLADAGEHAQPMDTLRRDVGLGVEQAQRGETSDASDVFDQLRARVDPALWAKAFGPGAWKGAGLGAAFREELRLGADALSRMRFTRVDEDGS